ncbi:MAG TPA: hypothetical protein DCZ72_05680 [Armatimonadetes bacterium]|nr:hypothetical protein [Armatimonadota bacterium]
MNLFSLSLLTFLPLIGMLVICAVPARRATTIRWVALVTTVFTFILSAGVVLRYTELPIEARQINSPSAAALGSPFSQTELVEMGQHPFAPPLGEYREWIPQAGISYSLGVDGLSLPLIVLTTALMILVIIFSWPVIADRPKWYYAFFLLLETAMIGVFVSLDLFLFYLFFEIGLVPMYFLIGIWGGPRREYAAIKFFLYTLVGSLAMLLAILCIYFYSGSTGRPPTFNLLELIALQPALRMAGLLPALCFLGIFLGFAIKAPMWPFHTWLPDAHVEAPTGGSVILAGILLKLGTYGFVRVLMPLLPEQCQAFGVFIVVLAAIAIVYGALVAMAQTDMKKLVAYSSVNHMGYTMLGIGAAMMVLNVSQATPQLARHAAMALNGAVLQMVAHGIITAGLFFMVGIVYERTHTRMIADYGGLMKVMPRYSGVFILLAMASLGLPMLAGFVAELQIFAGCVGVGISGLRLDVPGSATLLWATGFGLLGVVLNGAYFLWLIQRVLLGPLNETLVAKVGDKLTDLNGWEWATMIPLVIFTIWIGIHPGPIVLNMIDFFDHHLLQWVSGLLGGGL